MTTEPIKFPVAPPVKRGRGRPRKHPLPVERSAVAAGAAQVDPVPAAPRHREPPPQPIPKPPGKVTGTPVPRYGIERLRAVLELPKTVELSQICDDAASEIMRLRAKETQPSPWGPARRRSVT